jgi:hypothetical protein
MPVFGFPDDPVWNEDSRALEFSVEVGEYRGLVRVPRRVFQSLLPFAPTPEACIQAFYSERTRFERAVEKKIERRDLTEDGNLALALSDLV